ncbi:MAG TPA: hypothetical protein VGA08_02020 [Candidatus Saccharimonadales bacterium]
MSPPERIEGSQPLWPVEQIKAVWHRLADDDYCWQMVDRSLHICDLHPKIAELFVRMARLSQANRLSVNDQRFKIQETAVVSGIAAGIGLVRELDPTLSNPDIGGYIDFLARHRAPILRNDLTNRERSQVFEHMWDRGNDYLNRAGWLKKFAERTSERLADDLAGRIVCRSMTGVGLAIAAGGLVRQKLAYSGQIISITNNEWDMEEDPDWFDWDRAVDNIQRWPEQYL